MKFFLLALLVVACVNARSIVKRNNACKFSLQVALIEFGCLDGDEPQTPAPAASAPAASAPAAEAAPAAGNF
jgi:hypothetical protein